jgi:hypothetical protein
MLCFLARSGTWSTRYKIALHGRLVSREKKRKKKKPPDHRVFLGRRVVTNVEKVWTNHLIWM